MYPVLPVMKHYAWGSYDRLQSLMASSSLLHDEGIQAQDERPLAELWYGAHPQWPSSIAIADEGMQELSARIAQEPLDMLGVDCNERFGPSLPYLLKILAVRSPLSLQVHPIAHQARAGFNAEELSGIAHDDAKRSFPDAQEKNEMVVALDDFDASAGFRPIASIIHDLSIIDHEVAQEMFRALHHVQDDEGREIDKSVSGQGKFQEGKDSRGSFGIVSRSNHSNRLRNALRIAITASQQEGVANSLQCALKNSDPCNNAIRHAFIAAQQFPSDPSAFALVLMNPVSLCSGEALYIPAGTLHAYIHGFGAEIMTNSDAVLRAGLTVKHKDIAGALDGIRVWKDGVLSPHVLSGGISSGVQGSLFFPGLDEFELVTGSIHSTGIGASMQQKCSVAQVVKQRRLAEAFERSRPRMVVCIEGALRCVSDKDSRMLEAGDAVFVPASDGPLRLESAQHKSGIHAGPARYLLATTRL